ncbi:MAG: heme exporter protein CcmD [Confluentimicrobium sp.]|nr:heme exporter protein CcmD [Actibacterium sp.]MBF53537.1 heme exporter protein CcmD [Actibacterium sp.]|tara:strand:- start:661 stop:828 length:168 start_codon:yes stop_codon:yes gene_type:complete
MFDLGKYAAEVAWAYAATGILLTALVGLSLHRARRVRAALAAMEATRPRKEPSNG